MALSFLYVLASLVVRNTKIMEGFFLKFFKVTQIYKNILFFLSRCSLEQALNTS